MRNSCLKYAVDIGVAIEKEESGFLKRIHEDKDFDGFVLVRETNSNS